AAAVALGAAGLSWLYPVFALNELAAQGWSVCAMNYVLELCPPERAGRYTAVYHALSGPPRILLPLAGGVLIQAAGFSPVFLAATLGSLLSLALLLRLLPEPRHAPIK